MKRLGNTLYVLTDGAYIFKDGETIAVKAESGVKHFPIHNYSNVLCFGNTTCSTPFMGFCGAKGVGLSFFDSFGRFQARINGPVHGNVLLRREQYRIADNEDAKSRLAQCFVVAKIENSRRVIMRGARDKPEIPGASELREKSTYLLDVLCGLENPMPTCSVRGNEGDAARAYFSVFDHLITSQKGDFSFTFRTRRPPLDSVNAMLSFTYRLLSNDISSALEGVGLDPAVGFLHADRPGRHSLTLDMMEEFRAMMADRLVLSLINRRQVRAQGFEKSESGAVNMDDETRKTLITAWQERKRDEITHPFFGEKAPLGLLPHLQAQLLARYIRGDLQMYPPFIWK